jgi:transposase
VLDGIILRLRSRCQWERLPERFGPRSTVHGWFQRFAQDGALAEIWHYLARGCKELGEIYRQWQAVDGVMGKSRFGGEKTQPARRWVVERTIAWLQRCRALLIRYGKKPTNYLGLIQLACALRSTTAAISAYRPPEKFSNGF